ncbi:MAG: heavy metal-binding domain-containing protein [Acidimicrobiales bacterium]
MTSQDGGLPVDAALDALRLPAAGRPVASALSADEAILLDQVGFEPAGLVVGASVIQLTGYAAMANSLSQNGEMVELSNALMETRRRAISRLVAAAAGAPADGVVGVSLDAGDLRSSSYQVHMTAIGTAVRLKSGKRPHAMGAFSAALSGQDVHLLDRAGYAPLGIVAGVCAYHVGWRGFAQWASGVTQNTEMTLVTEALYEARELAMTRLQDQALALKADGVIGLTVTERPTGWGSHIIEFAATGTAVRVTAGGYKPLSPQLVIDLAADKAPV